MSKGLLFIFTLLLVGTVEARIKIPHGSDLTKVRLSSVECLAVNAYHEARGESDLANVIIMSVVTNRIKDKRFKVSTICESVFKEAAFSWTQDGLSDEITDGQQYKRLYKLADLYLINRKVYGKLLPSVDHYHSVKSTPSWANSEKLLYLETIGNHKFYHWKGGFNE